MKDSSKTLNVGVIGLGMMGQTHLDAYAKMPGVRVAAVADKDPDRLSGASKASGNVEGQAQGGFDLSSPDVKKYADGMELIADESIDIVDVCVPTPGHLPVGKAALEAGKHTLIEKPLARTFEQAKQLADAADAAWDKHQAVSMAAMCMRFWPGWDWLARAVADETYGPVRAASFRRVASFPGGPFYSNGEASGGAILDLHVHDTDFVRHAFAPTADASQIDVTTSGYTCLTGQPDHVHSTYHLPQGTAGVADDALITAEGGWAMSDGFGFSMRFTVNFERATADFDLARGEKPLQLHRGGKTETVDLPGGMGYDHELAYFIDCVKAGQPADRVSLRDAAQSIALYEKELASLNRSR